MPIPPFLLAATESKGIQQVWKYFADGGFFMIPLVVCSLVAVAVILFKVLSLRRSAVIPVALASQIDDFEMRMKQANGEAVLHEFEQGRSTLARLSSLVVKNRGKTQAEINEVVQAAAREEIVHLHAGMTALDVVITVAPLLGLLGTASGLVVVFGGLGDTSDYGVIALGIGQALSTTIAGLAIAVPAVIAQGWFQRRIETMAARLEVLLTRLAHAFESIPVATPPPIP